MQGGSWEHQYTCWKTKPTNKGTTNRQQQKKVKERVEATLTTTQDLPGNITNWWRNYPEQATEEQQERTLKTLYTQKNQLQQNLSTPE